MIFNEYHTADKATIFKCTHFSASPITFTFCCFNSYHKTISSNQSSTNLYTDNMTAESFFEPKDVLNSVERQYIGNISGPEKNISFINISAIYRDWLHSLGTRSAGKFLKVASTSPQPYYFLHFSAFLANWKPLGEKKPA